MSRRRREIWVTTTRRESIEETCVRGHWGVWIWVIGGWDIDTRSHGGGFQVVGLLMDLHLFFSLSPVSPLAIELDGLVLPNLERGGNWVHRVDAFFNSFDESFLEHLSEGDVVVATETLILLEVLNILFSGVGGHSDILEFSSSSGGRIGVAEAGLKLVNEVDE